MLFKNQNRETIHRIKKYEDKQCVVQHARTSSDHANITLFPKENSHIKLDVQKGRGAISQTVKDFGTVVKFVFNSDETAGMDEVDYIWTTV